MEETAESHAKNDISEMPLEIVADSLHEENSRAAGLPQNDIDDSKEAPYMLKVSDMKPCNPSSYCPIWKQIEGSFSVPGVKPPTMAAWLARGKLQIKSWESAKLIATHVTMNNGRFHIPDDKEEEFLRWYALSVTQNLRVWFVEQLTPVLRYFVDLDFAQLVGIPERTMEAVAKCVQQCVRSFYRDVDNDGESFIVKQFGEQDVERSDGTKKIYGTRATVDSSSVLTAIVCTTNYKFIKPKDGKPEMVKTGVHILWPNLYVTRDDALEIRESIIVALEKDFGKRVHPLNPWNDVVDSSVYGSGNSGTKGSGLRMVGSRKTDICDNCKGRKKIKSAAGLENQCSKCIGNGRLDTGRPYFPLCVLRSDGTRDHLQEERYRRDMQALIFDTKVRTRFNERPDYPRYAIPDHAPRRLAVGSTKGGRVCAADKEASKGIKKPTDASLKKSVTLELHNSTKEWDAILAVITGISGGIYKDVILSKVTMNSSRSQYVVHVSGDMCRYCHNVKREHVSNRIFFVIDASGIAQHCHDSATEPTEEMQYGLCKTYAGVLGRIPQNLVSVLFPSCAAAKTFAPSEPSTVEIDEDDPNAGMRRISDSRKMRRIMLIGDALSQELFKMNWSDTLRTSSGAHLIAARQKRARSEALSSALSVGDARYTEQYALDPAAIGSKGAVAMRNLGFDDIGLAAIDEDDTCADARKPVVPLTKLTALLFRDLDFGVELASSLATEELPQSRDMGGFDSLLSRRLLMATTNSTSRVPTSKKRMIRDA